MISIARWTGGRWRSLQIGSKERRLRPRQIRRNDYSRRCDVAVDENGILRFQLPQRFESNPQRRLSITSSSVARRLGVRPKARRRRQASGQSQRARCRGPRWRSQDFSAGSYRYNCDRHESLLGVAALLKTGATVIAENGLRSACLSFGCN